VEVEVGGDKYYRCYKCYMIFAYNTYNTYNSYSTYNTYPILPRHPLSNFIPIYPPSLGRLNFHLATELVNNDLLLFFNLYLILINKEY